jgi:alpha-L-fucosidase
VILTTKHHDGFCLYKSKFDHIDILTNFKKYALKYNLKFGIYYSWSEFSKGMTKKYLDEIVEPQIKEFCNPKIWWFDVCSMSNRKLKLNMRKIKYIIW